MKTMLSSLCAIVIAGFSWPVLADYANDRSEIENLSNKYMVAVDAGDIDTVMSTWHEEGRLVWVFGDEHGKEEIFGAMSGFGGARLPGNCRRSDQASTNPSPDHQPCYRRRWRYSQYHRLLVRHDQ